MSQASCSYKDTNIRKCFLSHVSLVKRVSEFKKVILCAHPTMWGEFKNFIHLIRTGVVEKIVDYSIYAMVNPFAGK